MSGVSGVIVTVLIRILEGLFVLGMIGSALVIVLATVEDAETLRGKNGED